MAWNDLKCLKKANSHGPTQTTLNDFQWLRMTFDE